MPPRAEAATINNEYSISVPSRGTSSLRSTHRSWPPLNPRKLKPTIATIACLSCRATCQAYCVMLRVLQTIDFIASRLSCLRPPIARRDRRVVETASPSVGKMSSTGIVVEYGFRGASRGVERSADSLRHPRDLLIQMPPLLEKARSSGYLLPCAPWPYRCSTSRVVQHIVGQVDGGVVTKLQELNHAVI